MIKTYIARNGDRFQIDYLGDRLIIQVGRGGPKVELDSEAPEGESPPAIELLYDMNEWNRTR